MTKPDFKAEAVRRSRARRPILMQSRYRDFYRGVDIVIRPRRYGNFQVRWEAYLSDEFGDPGEFLVHAPTRLSVEDAAHDIIDERGLAREVAWP